MNSPAPDLTAITQPFGTLDAQTKAALKASGGPIEKRSKEGMWWPIDTPGWYADTVYRLKPAAKPEG